MNKFKRGDKVYIFQKARPWCAGADANKDIALDNKTELTIDSYKPGYSNPCWSTYSKLGVLTVYEDCLKKVQKQLIVVKLKRGLQHGRKERKG